MNFASLSFVALILSSLLVFYSINPKFRVYFLILVSSIFIFSFSPYFLVYAIAFALINYYFGLAIHNNNKSKLLYNIALFTNILQLLLIKYFAFLFTNINALFKFYESNETLIKIIIPLGISFYTMQGIGYIINIGKGWEKPEKHLPHFLLYILFFPRFLSGPIDRSNKFIPQLSQLPDFNETDIYSGFKIALFGFFKKVVIADRLSFILNTFGNLDNTTGSTLLVTMLLLPIFLYFDFSGYTDIAVGIAKMFGIKIPVNFERPFFAENVSVFWRRFHISLSSWFNDYVFRQVSFNYRRWGNNASVFAVFVTFTLFGIWHGAGWHFMFLGLLQACAINYEFYSKRWRTQMWNKYSFLPKKFISRILVYLFYSISLVFFFSPDLTTAFHFIGNLFKETGISLSAAGILSLNLIFAYISIGIILLFEYSEERGKSGIIDYLSGKTPWLRYVIYYILIMVIIFSSFSKTSGFVYQQF